MWLDKNLWFSCLYRPKREENSHYVSFVGEKMHKECEKKFFRCRKKIQQHLRGFTLRQTMDASPITKKKKRCARENQSETR